MALANVIHSESTQELIVDDDNPRVRPRVPPRRRTSTRTSMLEHCMDPRHVVLKFSTVAARQAFMALANVIHSKSNQEVTVDDDNPWVRPRVPPQRRGTMSTTPAN